MPRKKTCAAVAALLLLFGKPGGSLLELYAPLRKPLVSRPRTSDYSDELDP
jgi:hypothetical protein